MISNLKENLSEILSDSHAYGLPKIFRSKRFFLKVYWFVFLIMGSLASIYYTVDAVNSYLQFDVITLTESRYEQPMLFPTISFCPYDNNAYNNKPLKSIVDICWFSLDHSCEYNPDNYFEKFKTFKGDCYRFNSGKNMSGHSIPLFYSTIGGRDDSFYLRLKGNARLQLWIHQASLPPKFNYDNNHLGNMIYVPSNADTQLVLNKIEEKKLGLPYNQCYNDLSLFPGNKTIIDYIYSKNETYKQINCLELCYDIDYINNERCECKNTSLGNVWEDCFVNHENKNSSGCIYNDKLIFFRESIINKSKDFCPMECETVSYSVNFNSINDGEIKFTVYFESLKYTLISQIPKTREFDLLSNIGGIFGLFIGVSFVTVFEIGEVFIEVFYIISQRKKTNQIVRVESVQTNSKRYFFSFFVT